MLSDKKIQEIEERVKNLIPGEWIVKPNGTMSGAWFDIKDSNDNIIFESHTYATNKCIKYRDMDEEWYMKPEKWNFEQDGQAIFNNAVFVANAKSDIIALINEIKRLKVKRI